MSHFSLPRCHNIPLNLLCPDLLLQLHPGYPQHLRLTLTSIIKPASSVASSPLAGHHDLGSILLADSWERNGVSHLPNSLFLVSVGTTIHSLVQVRNLGNSLQVLSPFSPPSLPLRCSHWTSLCTHCLWPPSFLSCSL